MKNYISHLGNFNLSFLPLTIRHNWPGASFRFTLFTITQPYLVVNMVVKNKDALGSGGFIS